MHPPKPPTSNHANAAPTPGPWENSPPNRPMVRNLHRQELVDRVRLLLLRQKRAYSRRLKALHQQSRQCQMQTSELIENNQQLRLTIDVPGVDPSDIQVQIDTVTRTLSISAKRIFKSLDEVTCRRTQVLCRQYRVHPNVILRIKASLQNGVLTITAPKALSSFKEVDHEDDVDSEVPTTRSSLEVSEHDSVVSVPISCL